ncbi:MAG: LamB/YcsF family protein [Planctomycetota bacterium]|nr:LamB/YcsF family protein [Planctomycetota bacterium]
MTTRPLLNADLGEEPLELARDEALAELVDVLNIACGGHAGDTSSMARFAALASRPGGLLAAHPSYPDRPNFGRVRMNIQPQALAESLRSQLRALKMAAGETPIAWVKPHGALYHAAMTDAAVAHALLDAARDVSPGAAIVTQAGPVGDALAQICADRGTRVVREAFADRRLDDDGRLLPRTDPRALITDPREALEHATRLWSALQFDTLCVHADTPNALAIVRELRRSIGG